MKYLVKLLVVLTVTFALLLAVTFHFRHGHKEETFRELKPSGTLQRKLTGLWDLNLNSSHDYGIFRGISKLQFDQAMAERRLPPLKPKILDPEDFSLPSKSIFIFTTWRSGSSFLGDLISSVPGVFYSYEPLHFVDQDSHINAGFKAQQSVSLLQSLLRCQFPQDYLTHINGGANGTGSVFISNNRPVWSACSHDKSLCSQPEFLRRLCVHFPIHLIKTVRLRLSHSETFLNDEDSRQRTKVVFLVRDPRAVMASRANLTWCSDPSCKDPKILCEDMLDDLNAFHRLQRKYPDIYRLVKHEELSFHPEEETQELMNFLGIKTTLTKVFLKTHTQSNVSSKMVDPYSTTRNSTQIPNEWRKKLNTKQIRHIEGVCKDVMKMLGYKIMF